MNSYIHLSQITTRLMRRITSQVQDATLTQWLAQPDHTIKLIDIINWLAKPIVSQRKTRYLLESIRSALLGDIHQSIDLVPHQSSSQTLGNDKKIKFHFLVLAGTLLAFCGGFNGITTLLTFLSVPALLSTVIGIVFSLVSIAFYYGTDINELSEQLGVKYAKSQQLIDAILQQIQHISNLRKDIEKAYIHCHTLSELKTLHQLVSTLIKQYGNIAEIAKDCQDALDSPYLKLAKGIATVIRGVLIFSSGFFAGQTVSLALGSLFLPTISVTFWPIVVASIAIGLAALGIYCLIQHTKYENRIGQLVGIDKDKIDLLINKNNTVISKLELLKQKIGHELTLKRLLTNSDVSLPQPQQSDAEPRSNRSLGLDPTAIEALRFNDLDETTQRSEHSPAFFKRRHSLDSFTRQDEAPKPLPTTLDYHA